jgi:hypothetical protein
MRSGRAGCSGAEDGTEGVSRLGAYLDRRLDTPDGPQLRRRMRLSGRAHLILWLSGLLRNNGY